MIAIKDFEMPKSCIDCPLIYEEDHNGGSLCCAVTNECVEDCWNNGTKHEACPLVEVEVKERLNDKRERSKEKVRLV